MIYSTEVCDDGGQAAVGTRNVVITEGVII